METKNTNETKVNSELSHSKQKRIEREKKENRKKADRLIVNIVIGVAIACLVAIVGTGIAKFAIDQANTIVASDDFSKEINDAGFIKGVNTKDYITLCDYKNIIVPKSEVEYTDEQVDADIETALEAHMVLKTDDITVNDGDTVNADYVGVIDGVEFDGGSTNGEGTDITIGSGSLIDDFEQQLIGTKPGDVVVVKVTFPEDYAATELAGKDAEFTTTINGVYVKPEYDDDFVCAYYAAYADTAEGYRQYLKDSYYEDAFNAYVTNYIAENTVANSYPKKFLKNYKETTMYLDEESYEYTNEMYKQYYGQGYNSLAEYMGTTEEGYLEQLDTNCKEKVKNILAYQAILENEGITVTDDDLKNFVEKSFGSADDETVQALIDNYGRGYMKLDIIAEKALDIAKENAKVQ